MWTDVVEVESPMDLRFCAFLDDSADMVVKRITLGTKVEVVIPPEVLFGHVSGTTKSINMVSFVHA